jgi:hypothetical protein
MNLKKPLTPKVIYTALLFTTEALIKRKAKNPPRDFLMPCLQISAHLALIIVLQKKKCNALPQHND